MENVHEVRASEIVDLLHDGAVSPLRAQKSARQGDLVMRMVPGVARPGAPTPPSGIVLAAGMHGEHRLIAEEATVKGTVVHLPRGGLVVHTDVPAGRHRPVLLAPGRWEFLRQQEIGINDVVTPVRD